MQMPVHPSSREARLDDAVLHGPAELPVRRMPAASNAERRWGPYVVQHRSRAQSVYHCCMPKTASQWIRAILSDPRVFVYSGLRPVNVYERYESSAVDPDPRERLERIPEADLHQLLPTSTVVTPLYVDYQTFQTIPRPDRYKAFFVMRDPRDILVSWYFSMKQSHPLLGGIPWYRESVRERSGRDGLAFAIDALARLGVFAALDSWQQAARDDPNVSTFRFEDLAGPFAETVFRCLFVLCDIRLPSDVVPRLIDDYRFDRLSAGRRPGEEDVTSHYRKGIAGDWQNHFDGSLERAMRDTTGDLVTRLGYSW
jgi:hypothetical protein